MMGGGDTTKAMFSPTEKKGLGALGLGGAAVAAAVLSWAWWIILILALLSAIMGVFTAKGWYDEYKENKLKEKDKAQAVEDKQAERDEKKEAELRQREEKRIEAESAKQERQEKERKAEEVKQAQDAEKKLQEKEKKIVDLKDKLTTVGDAIGTLEDRKTKANGKIAAENAKPVAPQGQAPSAAYKNEALIAEQKAEIEVCNQGIEREKLKAQDIKAELGKLGVVPMDMVSSSTAPQVLSPVPVVQPQSDQQVQPSVDPTHQVPPNPQIPQPPPPPPSSATPPKKHVPTGPDSGVVIASFADEAAGLALAGAQKRESRYDPTTGNIIPEKVQDVQGESKSNPSGVPISSVPVVPLSGGPSADTAEVTVSSDTSGKSEVESASIFSVPVELQPGEVKDESALFDIDENDEELFGRVKTGGVKKTQQGESKLGGVPIPVSDVSPSGGGKSALFGDDVDIFASAPERVKTEVEKQMEESDRRADADIAGFASEDSEEDAEVPKTDVKGKGNGASDIVKGLMATKAEPQPGLVSVLKGAPVPDPTEEVVPTGDTSAKVVLSPTFGSGPEKRPESELVGVGEPDKVPTGSAKK